MRMKVLFGVCVAAVIAFLVGNYYQNSIIARNRDFEKSNMSGNVLKSLWEYAAVGIRKQPVSLSQFKGKAALVINVASQCGYTDGNYKQLERVYQKYKDQGFVVLAFPCNQFGAQEPGSNEEIEKFACERYSATYPIFDKIEVNGPKENEIYHFLKASFPGDIGWNFEKFLVDRDGVPVQRYKSGWKSSIEADIEHVLGSS
eukprot:TRINITY_DN6644_c0_g1_i1.p1 TRINITY_DN6644_c0_g1~~TRINITY_DN6644_c0_g1_i1.p1  ORF type:complete len:201 (-),score=56.83 TRINITY_DN6644_c0_g1_i1:371-973(-)